MGREGRPNVGHCVSQWAIPGNREGNDRPQRVDGGKLLMARLEFALDLAVSFLFAFMHDLKSTFVPSNATHPISWRPLAARSSAPARTALPASPDGSCVDAPEGLAAIHAFRALLTGRWTEIFGSPDNLQGHPTVNGRR